MLSQRQMKEWIPETIELFKSVMASNHAPFPEICIVSDKTMDRIRNSLLARTQSQAKLRVEIPAMETLHGPGGDAIIIYQNVFRGAYWDEESKGRFQHFLWHELGHFYALNMEDPADNYSRFMDQKPHPDEYEALLGYSFWSEFIAEVIACKVTPALEIDWEGYNWYPIRNELLRLLFGALNTSGMGINWYDLAFYIAKVTSDKTVLGFIDAAKKGVAKVRNTYNLFSSTEITFEEAGLDPIGMNDIADEPLRIIKDLYRYMELQLAEEEYWKVTYEDLETIGAIIHALERTILIAEFKETMRGSRRIQQ